MIKELLLKLFFWYYRREYYRPLNEIEVEKLLIKIATTPGLESLPRYLGQCADTARNQYLYSNDEIFKGVILAFTTLRQQIIKFTPKKEKVLTDEEKVVIMKKRGY